MVGSILVLGALLAGQADAAVDDELRLTVRRIVRQLDASELAARDEAEQKLVEMGPKVLPLLPRITSGTSAEMKQRLGRIRQKLQQAAAEAAANASTVTIQLTDASLSEVLEALRQQSGNAIVDYRGRFGQEATDPKISLDVTDAPFWQTLDQVLDDAGLTVYPFGDERAICVVASDESQRARSEGASYVGPFRFEPLAVQAQRDFRAPNGQWMKLNLQVAWEPRLKPISLVQKLADLKAVDEKGNPLQLDSRRTELEVPVGDNATAVGLIVPFVLPPRSVNQIASLKGKLDAMIPGNVESFRFGDLLTARQVEKRSAGVSVTLQEVRRNGPIWEFRILIRFDEAAGALASHRGWIFQNEAYLEDREGKKIPFDSFETTRQTSNEVGLAYLFGLDAPPAGYRFVYNTPGVIVATGFDYEIKDVDLP